MTKDGKHEPAPQPGKEIVLPHVFFDVMRQSVEHCFSTKKEMKIVKKEIVEDLTERAEFGKKKYGTYLQTFNGRKALTDAYQEMLDCIMYLKQQSLETNDILPDIYNKTIEIAMYLKQMIIKQRIKQREKTESFLISSSQQEICGMCQRFTFTRFDTTLQKGFGNCSYEKKETEQEWCISIARCFIPRNCESCKYKCDGSNCWNYNEWKPKEE